MNARSAIALATILLSTSAMGDSPIIVDGAGRAIGYSYDNSVCGNPPGFGIYSRTSYLTCIRSNGQIDTTLNLPTGGSVGGEAPSSETWFAMTNCTGTAYAPLYNASGPAQGGFVIETQVGLQLNAVGTIAQAALPESVAIGTHASPDCSSPAAPPSVTFFPLGNADPAVTGLSNVPYAQPLSIRVLPDSALNDEIFFDGFEIGY